MKNKGMRWAIVGILGIGAGVALYAASRPTAPGGFQDEGSLARSASLAPGFSTYDTGQFPPPEQGAPRQAGGYAPPSDAAAPPPYTAASIDTAARSRFILRDNEGAAAGFFLAPADWQLVGGLTWNDDTGCPGNMLQQNWSLIAPDSLTAIGVVPGFSWQQPGTEIPTSACPSGAFRNVQEFLQATAAQLHPDGRILDYEDTNEAYAARRAAKGETVPTGRTIEYDAGRILVGFRRDGVEMRGILSAEMSTSWMQGNAVSMITSVQVYYAPEGRLDPALPEHILATAQPDQEWAQTFEQRMQGNVDRFFSNQRRQIDEWHAREMAMINARGNAERHAIRMRTNQEVAGIYSAIAANTSATNERIIARTGEGIREVNTWHGTGGTVVESSIHGGSRVFQDPNDPNRAFSTNDPYANPGPGWTELEQRR